MKEKELIEKIEDLIFEMKTFSVSKQDFENAKLIEELLELYRFKSSLIVDDFIELGGKNDKQRKNR